MADKTVRQRDRFRGQEIERDPLERRAVCAGRDVSRSAGWAAVAKSFDRADRLHIPRGRSDPRNPVGDGRRRVGKRRARRGGGVAKDRRAEGDRACSASAGKAPPRASGQAGAGSANQLKQPRPKALISWSSGKDSAFALHEVRRAGEFEVVGALTTVTETFDRVSIHGVRQEILRAQCLAAGLPPRIVPIPYPCPNEIYEARMGEAVAKAVQHGITHIIFGDLFLADIKAYREQKLAGTGITPVFPLWQRPTLPLAHAMIASGMEAYLATVDLKKLPAEFTGRKFDLQLLADLPDSVDPCGENGEFHTCVVAGPIFSRRLPVAPGERVERDGYGYRDLVLGRDEETPRSAPRRHLRQSL